MATTAEATQFLMVSEKKMLDFMLIFYQVPCMVKQGSSLSAVFKTYGRPVTLKLGWMS